jgi:cyclophilin family peptidyl-prolyl cis-trans isomerase/HEAT repeat protein
LVIPFLIMAPPACKRGAGTPDAGAAADARATIDAQRSAVALLEHMRKPWSAEWAALARSPAWDVRERVALAIGRAARVEGHAVLVTLLEDIEAAVRRAAAFALGCFEDRLPLRHGALDVRNRMLARFGEETDGSVIAALVLAYGRLGGDPARRVIELALSYPLVEVREAAGLAAGRLAAHPADQPMRLAPALHAAFAREKEAAPRVAMAFAMARLGAPAPSALRERDRDERVRFFVWQALAKERGAATLRARIADHTKSPKATPHPLVSGLEDDDFLVRIAALGAAASAGEWLLAGKALQRAWLAFAASPESLRSEKAHVVLAAIDALGRATEPLPAEARKNLEDVHWSSNAKESVVRYSPEALRSLDAVHCASATLLDVIDGVRRRVKSCGTPRIFEWQTKRLSARVVSRSRLAPQNTQLRAFAELIRDTDPRVRSGAAAIAAPLWSASGTKPLVLEALRTRDAAVLGALADAIAERGSRDPDVEAALIAAAPSLRTGADADVMVSFAHALGAVGSPKAAPVLLGFAGDAVAGVREAARKVFRALYPSDPDPPPPTATLDGFPAAVTREGPPLSARVETTKGSFEIRLHRHLAPVTVGNFVALAKKGFYRDQFIHRVVPAFVTQMGDPRGDGAGGPGYAIPCELNESRYRRGSVGMALAGRDTGGSQFFITHTETPHLDGAYTHFGEVTQGLDVVLSLVEGDKLLRIVISEGS